MFNLKALHDLVKKVIDEKLIEKYFYTFVKSRNTDIPLHFLNYNELIEVSEVLSKYSSACYISYDSYKQPVYFFDASSYNNIDFKNMSNKEIFTDNYEESGYALEVDDKFQSIFLVREFWKYCKVFIDEDMRNRNKSEENMNKEITETKEETFSIEDIYKIITDSEGFGKIIEGMEDIGFTDETIYEVILNLVKRLN